MASGFLYLRSRFTESTHYCWSVTRGAGHVLIFSLGRFTVKSQICIIIPEFARELLWCSWQFIYREYSNRGAKNYWVFGLFPSSDILVTRKHNVSETGSVSVLRWRGEKIPIHLGPLEWANLNHWTTLSYLRSYLITWDQANPAEDNKKVHNKNCDKARACVELG
jgi:hypothetical protein